MSEVERKQVVSVNEHLHIHHINAGLEAIIGCTVAWLVTHSIWWTLAAGIVVVINSKIWSRKE